MAVAASLNVLLTAQTAAFQSGMKRAENSTKQLQGVIGRTQATLTAFRTAVSGAAAAIGASKLASSYVEVLNKFDDTADAADRLGVKFQELKAIQDASIRGGLEVAGITANLEKLSLTLGKARQGSEQAQKAFASIGLGAAVAGNGNAAEVFFQVIDSLRRMSDESQRAAAASAIFGKNQQEVLTLLSMAPAQYAAVQSAMMDVASQSNDAMIDSLARQKKKVDELAVSWENLKIQIVGIAGIMATDFMRAVAPAGRTLGDTPRNRDVEQIIAKRGEAFIQAQVAKTVAYGNELAKALEKSVKLTREMNHREVVGRIRQREAEEKRMSDSRGRVNFFATLATGVMAAADKVKLDAARISPAASTLTAGSNASRLFDFNRQQADRAEKLLKKPAEQQVQLLQKVRDVLERIRENTNDDTIFDIF